MKKECRWIIPLMVISVFLLRPGISAATIWTYSGATQGTFEGDPTVYDFSFNVNISDRLWDRSDQQYVTPTQGAPLPLWHRFMFNIYDWSMEINGVEQLSGNSGNVEAGIAVASDPGLADGTIQEYDSLVLESDHSLLYFDRGPSWLDDQGNPWDFANVNSPTYGQLAPVLTYNGMGISDDFSGFSFASLNTIQLIRDPNPVSNEPIPEPATIILTILGFFGVGIYNRRTKITHAA